MTYDEYRARFFATVPLLQFPHDCLVGMPAFKASSPNVWQLAWAVEFGSDNTHFVCRELWSHRLGKPARRHLFTFHYGPTVRRSPDGRITHGYSDPVILRLDKKNGEPEHLHFDGPEHYNQDRVKGIVIDDVDLFDFVRAVLNSRKTGTPIKQLLGFELT